MSGNHEIIDAERLTVYLTETARHAGQPLFEWLVEQALQMKLAGATAHKGLLGYGRHRRVHQAHLVELSADLPIVVEMIDTAAKIDAFLESAAEALHGQTYIRERVRLHQPPA